MLKFVLKFYSSIIQYAQYIYDKKVRMRSRIRTSDKRIRIQEAQKHVDPDPQHRILQYLALCLCHVL